MYYGKSAGMALYSAGVNLHQRRPVLTTVSSTALPSSAPATLTGSFH